MGSIPCGDVNIINGCLLFASSSTRTRVSVMGISAFPFSRPRSGAIEGFMKERVICRSLFANGTFPFLSKGSSNMMPSKVRFTVSRSSKPSNSSGSEDESSEQVKGSVTAPVTSMNNSMELWNQRQVPFGYSRKDVLLIGVGVTLLGIGLKSGLEFYGVDPLQAGNVVQLVLVLGLTVGWISTYIFRVSNKEMTYAQQLRDYENKVMQKRLEGLTQAELEALLEQVEEENRRLASGEKID
ncbi:hypothetical protein LguiA_009256 [Lonicera macranthoides]